VFSRHHRKLRVIFGLSDVLLRSASGSWSATGWIPATLESSCATRSSSALWGLPALARRRLRLRPGLTCLWILAGRDEVDFENWMKMDMEYIDNWSLALDCEIILSPLPRVLTGEGAN